MHGYKINRLLKLLQENFPERDGHQVVWKAEDFHPARGAWRKKSMDVWSWQAYASYADGDGVAYHVGSYATVTELIKCKRLEIIGGDEVYGVEEKPDGQPKPAEAS